MPFTEQNKPLLEEAVSIDFQFGKDGRINSARHTKYELGLYFVKRAVEVHGAKYGYSRVNYVNNSTKVIVLCTNHGEFEQTPRDHIAGKGCKLCARNALQTTDTFISRASDIHGDKYDYSVTNYTGANDKLDVICPIHGLYSIRASHHLSGIGCAQCSYDSLKMPIEEFLARAKEVHGDRYDYSLVLYKNNRERVEIVCPEHGSFFQVPDNHIHSGSGCPKCAGQNHNILYLLKCRDTGWYKIGITSNIKQRISGIGGYMERIHHVLLEDPRKHEAILHKRYKKDREYNLCVRSGNTEFFSLTKAQVLEVIAYMNEVSDG